MSKNPLLLIHETVRRHLALSGKIPPNVRAASLSVLRRKRRRTDSYTQFAFVKNTTYFHSHKLRIAARTLGVIKKHMESKVLTADIKHIFIDIVNYTHNRSVEAQTELIETTNGIVKNSLSDLKVDIKKVIFIPTGDGMCISLINVLAPYDIHLKIGLDILKKLGEYNKSQSDEMRQFGMRIGINENIDNIITDINNQKNISGSGINMAARIEGLADKNQILVGNSVFEKLSQREKYMKSFASYESAIKHGLSIKVHQYKNKDFNFLNSDIPSRFSIKAPKKKILTEFEAHYIANCIIHHDFIKSRLNDLRKVHALHSLFYHLTLDEINKSRTTEVNPSYTSRISVSLDKYFETLINTNIWLLHDIRYTVSELKLQNSNNCFKEKYLIVNSIGKKRLQSEQPTIFSYYKLN